jgi:hypothetical protein
LHQIAEETKVFHPLQYYLYVPVVMHGSEWFFLKVPRKFENVPSQDS